jgi:hypothetical protein
MYVVRLKLIDSSVNFNAFTSRHPALSFYEVSQNQVIDEGLEESALFDDQFHLGSG